MDRILNLCLGILIGVTLLSFSDLLQKKRGFERAHNLGLMRYNAKTDSFVPKDTIVLTGTELNYLITGKK